MHTGKGQVVEVVLDGGFRHARISCAANLIPPPGQYLLAGTASQSDLLPVSLFSTESTLKSIANHSSWQTFTACAPIPESWTPGTQVNLRGPLGHGFTLPASARKTAFVAFDDSPARLHGLMQMAAAQAAVVLVSDLNVENVPEEVEVQPLSALGDVVEWADYTAFDVARENLPGLRQMLGKGNQASVRREAQILVRTPMPCGGIADCGVCALSLKSNWKFSCKDGPVFKWADI